MTIDPTTPGASSPTPPAGPRLDQSGSSQSARQPGEARAAAGAAHERQAGADDQVQISAEAREAGRSDGTTSASGLTTERLREILKRITSGYYDSAQVRDAVARRITDEFNGR